MKKTIISILIFSFILSFGLLTVQSSVNAESTIEIWHVFPDDAHFWNEAVEMWNEEFGDEIILEQRFIPMGEYIRELTQAIMLDMVPDLVTIDNPDFASFVEMGALADITDKVDEWGEADLYYDGPWNTVEYDDTVYGVPLDSNTLALFYNKDLFEEAGLDPDSPPETWSELKEYSQRLTNPQENVRGISFSATRSEEGTFQFLPFVQQSGGEVFNLRSNEAIEALEFWTDFVDNGWATPEVINMTQNEAMGLFSAQNVAMTINGPWTLGQLSEVEFNWGLTLLPVKDDVGINASALGGFNIAITDGSNNKDEAWKFLQWLQSKEVMEELYWNVLGGARIPSRSDIAEAPGKWVEDDSLAVFINQLEYAQPRGPHHRWPEISNAIQIAIQEALTGSRSAEEALIDAANEIDSFLE